MQTLQRNDHGISPATATGQCWLEVSLQRQQLLLMREGGSIAQYPVSTASRGAGERNGSGCTPLGLHVVRAMIGAGLPAGAVLVGRRPTGEIWSPELARRHPERDWILTRILWLGGLEPGRNRFGEVDTMRRYIYIHGTPDTARLGSPVSHGCIRMHDADVIELFDQVAAGVQVRIS